MRLSQYIEREPEVRRKKAKPKSAKPSIVSHGAFVPILGLWGAALFGLAVMVMPPAVIDRVSAVTDGAVAGDGARFAFAGVAALLGGALTFVIGGALRSKTLRRDSDRPIASAVTARRVHPINPASDLGSASLDAPLESMPFARDDESEEAEFEDLGADDESLVPEKKREPTLGELAERNYEMEASGEAAPAQKAAKGEMAFTRKQFQSALIESCEGATCEASPARTADERPARVVTKRKKPGNAAAPGVTATLSSAAPRPQPANEARPVARQPKAGSPRELSLAEFGSLPNRNAVWVEEKAGKVDRTDEASRPGPIPATALQKLRQTPPDQLSLVEMVERFAGALHEHQQVEHSRRPAGQTGRDAALVEALKALTLFTERGFDQGDSRSPRQQLGETERELREALAKLQTLRGAA